MAKVNRKGVMVAGSLRADGVTVYMRLGKAVLRSATSRQPRRRTRGQFEARQRLAHANTLWRRLRAAGEGLVESAGTGCNRFQTLMAGMPTVYMTRGEHASQGSLLLPGMPVSEGVLAEVGYRLGEVEGRPALLTTLRVGEGLGEGATAAEAVRALRRGGCKVGAGERLRLYRLRQVVEQGVPKVYAAQEEWVLDGRGAGQPFAGLEVRSAEGCLALVGEALGEAMAGWALVRRSGRHCSSQGVATRCRLWEGYATEEALRRAARSYGGLTGEGRGSARSSQSFQSSRNFQSFQNSQNSQSSWNSQSSRIAQGSSDSRLKAPS